MGNCQTPGVPPARPPGSADPLPPPLFFWLARAARKAASCRVRSRPSRRLTAQGRAEAMGTTWNCSRRTPSCARHSRRRSPSCASTSPASSASRACWRPRKRKKRPPLTVSRCGADARLASIYVDPNLVAALRVASWQRQVNGLALAGMLVCPCFPWARKPAGALFDGRWLARSLSLPLALCPPSSLAGRPQQCPQQACIAGR